MDRIDIRHVCSDAAGHELRCECGSLLARWIDAGIELKCRRCKRRICVLPPPSDSRPPPAGTWAN